MTECHALCVLTAQWGHPACGPAPSWASSVRGPGTSAATRRTSPTGCGRQDGSILPHLDLLPTTTMARAERWAVELDGPAYAIDEQTAVTVVDGSVEVVSEGRWRRFGA